MSDSSASTSDSGSSGGTAESSGAGGDSQAAANDNFEPDESDDATTAEGGPQEAANDNTDQAANDNVPGPEYDQYAADDSRSPEGADPLDDGPDESDDETILLELTILEPANDNSEPGESRNDAEESSDVEENFAVADLLDDLREQIDRVSDVLEPYLVPGGADLIQAGLLAASTVLRSPPYAFEQMAAATGEAFSSALDGMKKAFNEYMNDERSGPR